MKTQINSDDENQADQIIDRLKAPRSKFKDSFDFWVLKSRSQGRSSFWIDYESVYKGSFFEDDSTYPKAITEVPTTIVSMERKKI